MSPIDLRVFILINGVMAILMAVVLYAQARSYPRSIRGMGAWAFAQLAFMASTVLFGVQHRVHPLLGMGLANALLIGGGGVLLLGTCQHLGLRVRRRWVAYGMVPVCLMAGWLSGPPHWYTYRVLMVAGSLTLLFAFHAWVVWRHGPPRIGVRFTLATLCGLTLVMALRALTVFTHPPPPGIFVPSPVQVAYLASLSFGLLLMPIGGILMASERLRDELEALANKDSLTGAYTRRALFQAAESALARCRRLGTDVSVLLIDLDHFKQINDRHGHLMGDQVLTDFAARAQALLRWPALLGRFGGEEFVALLPDTGPEAALRVAERLRTSAPLPGLPVCHLSIGVATLKAGESQGFSDLIARADAALYRAKHAGRNRVEWGD